MKKFNIFAIGLILFAMAIGFVLAGCDLFTEGNETNDDSKFTTRKMFLTADPVSGSLINPNHTYARLKAEGTYCYVWVKEGLGVNGAMAETIANKFDTGIYPKMLNTFGSSLTFDGEVYPNPMALADYFGDKNGKLNILVLDLRGDNSGIDGYFFDGDFYDQYNSNKCDIIYVNYGPHVGVGYTTLAHEMQHMMNFVTGIAKGRPDGSQDTWVNEGLSSAAEWVYEGAHTQWKVDWYKGADNPNKNEVGYIAEGNNFYVWHNYDNNPRAIYDDYATVYLFFQWLRLQAGNIPIYKNIASSSDYDSLAVTEAMSAVDSGYAYWTTLLETWLAANFINSSSGRYGYKNDPVLKDIKGFLIYYSSGTYALAPGEGFYTKTNTNPNLYIQGPNIQNAFISSTGEVRDSGYYPGGYMISYNSNLDYDGSSEYGWIASSPSGSISLNSVPGRRNAGRPASFSNIRIDARDIFRRNGMERRNTSGSSLPAYKERVLIDE